MLVCCLGSYSIKYPNTNVEDHHVEITAYSESTFEAKSILLMYEMSLRYPNGKLKAKTK